MGLRESVAGLSLVLVSGCASLPETVVAPTGEPLSTDGRTTKYTYTKKQKVGYVEGRDSRGYRTTTSVYADKKATGTAYTWSSYQGEKKISDDDLFHIAKDPEMEEYRSSGQSWGRIGLIVGGAGLAALAGGAVWFTQLKDKENADGTTTEANRTVPYGLIIGGAVLSTIGFFINHQGNSKVTADHPFAQERVQQTADKYNATLTNQPPAPEPEPEPEGEPAN